MSTPFHAIGGICFQRTAEGIRLTREHRGFANDCYDDATGGYADWDEELATIPFDIWKSVVKICTD